MTRIKNQPLKWHGGKSYLATWLHSLAPPSVQDDPDHGYTHRNIVFGGGLGEFWNWLPVEGISEAVNDSDQALSNFYKVLASPSAFAALQVELGVTPFSQTVWEGTVGGGDAGGDHQDDNPVDLPPIVVPPSVRESGFR
jgi:DNA adenine methylase